MTTDILDCAGSADLQLVETTEKYNSRLKNCQINILTDSATFIFTSTKWILFENGYAMEAY